MELGRTVTAMASKRCDPWPTSIIEAVAAVLGHTDYGLTRTEIGQLLGQVPIADPCAGITKRHRLSAALLNDQARSRYATGSQLPG